MRLIAAAVIVCIGAGGALAQDAVWQRVVDPTEQAFSLDVPRGWKVNAGITRRSAIQPHAIVTMVSPGGATQMLLGNVEAISYAVPTPLGVQLGFHEGTLYAPNGDTQLVLRYHTGQQWAERYGHRLLTQGGCQHIQVLGTRDRSDARPRPTQPSYPPFHATAGDAFFTCVHNGHTLEAYVFSRTELTGDQRAAVWNADNTYGFSTPAGHGMAAGFVMTHIIESLQTNPQWLATQLQVSSEVAHQALATANTTLDANARALHQTFTATQQAARANQAEFGRLISGFDEYQTASGDKQYVPYGAATNWWSNTKGQTLGTQGPLSPGMPWQEMQRVPPTGK